MTIPLILASASPTRARLLADAGVAVTTRPARVDEDALRAAMTAEGIRPRDQADMLAEQKARRVAAQAPGAVVIGCDQVLDFRGEVWGKPADADAARAQLLALRGQTHHLHTAVVLYEAGAPVWRHVDEARLTMRDFSDAWLAGYIARAGAGITETVGGYRIEAEGIRLFSRIDGDHFGILGLPLLPLLTYLGQRGMIES